MQRYKANQIFQELLHLYELHHVTVMHKMASCWSKMNAEIWYVCRSPISISRKNLSA
jgi:hypothetical protein